jgi:transposase
MQRLGRFEAGKMREGETKTDALDSAIAAAAKELDQLTQLRVRSFISEEEFLRQRETLDRRRLALTQRREKHPRPKIRSNPRKCS